MRFPLSCIQKMPPMELQWLLMRSKLPYKKMFVEISMQLSIFSLAISIIVQNICLYWFVSVKSCQNFFCFFLCG
ncbi:hypothetical protein OIU79_018056 [Salix purpurea]|uniref:Uncharacterized protein n=1 Tax=Salix purpurea TaxID=77065 RepID=A0A9Q1AKY4_SALPP|nr:hypothetical protein OIU79_018056 [Salix purpurea]